MLLVFMPILSDKMDLPSSSNVDYISATYPAVMQEPLFINPMMVFLMSHLVCFIILYQEHLFKLSFEFDGLAKRKQKIYCINHEEHSYFYLGKI